MCVLCVADVCVVCCRLLMCCCCVMEARGEAPAASVLPGVDPGGRPLLWPRSGSVASKQQQQQPQDMQTQPPSHIQPSPSPLPPPPPPLTKTSQPFFITVT
uniref:Secreted protein n=1 Tax=Knipowitschia caucasica TaxID=637954 RepID=A0AAV2KMK7_KNICA